MAAQPTDSEKARRAAAEAVNPTHPSEQQDQPTTPDSRGVKKTTGTPMAEHPAATRLGAAPRRRANVGSEIRFKIEHTQVGAHMQGSEVTQEQLGVDDAGLERLLDLDAVSIVLYDPTAEQDDAGDLDDEEE